MNLRSIRLPVLLVLAGAGLYFFLRPAPSPLPLASTPLPSDDSSLDPVARGASDVPALPGSASGAASAAPGAPPVLDRAKRDAVRALIWRSFGEETPDAAPPAKSAYVLPKLPPWPDGPTDSGPGIEPKYIQDSVRKQFFPIARDCYTDLMKRAPDAGGRAVLAFNIVGNQNIGGIVEQVDVLDESTLRDPDFVDCMRQSFLSVTFPPPEGGGMVSVEYPIEFSPEDAED